jgi:hypothetical protein
LLPFPENERLPFTGNLFIAREFQLVGAGSGKQEGICKKLFICQQGPIQASCP